MVNGGILSAVGNTPMVKLTRILKDIPIHLYAKLEFLNPGGSMKDRPAFNMIHQAMRAGELQPGSVVVESSSGNLGVGLAMACAYLGLRFICVIDPKTTAQNIHLMTAYGAEVDLITEPDPVTGDYLQARINRVKELVRTINGSFWPNQYSNGYNPLAHHRTMEEIVNNLGGKVDYIFCATSTCGTLVGCTQYIRERHLNTEVIAVDAVGSVIFGGRKTNRLIPGHGASMRPQLLRPDFDYRHVSVSDLDCVIGCRRMASEEAILAGGSSGAIIMAIDKMRDWIEPDATCVAIFADRGERYLDTIYSDAWVNAHFGEVSHFWKNSREGRLWMTAEY
jgi:2,3-diaminopropionate biosynthesis protein SbnA